MFELMSGGRWHLLGRIRSEIADTRSTTHKLERCGSEVECGRTPATMMRQLCPGIAATENKLFSLRRVVANNRLLIKVLQLRMDAYTLVGNFFWEGGA